jgi:hypothetical protein
MFDAVNIHIAFDILWKVLHLIFHYATKIEVAATDKKTAIKLQRWDIQIKI